MVLRIDVRLNPDGEAVVELAGALNSDTAVECEARLDGLLKDSVKKIILDLKNLKYISSAGLRLALKTRKDLKKAGGSLELRNMSAPVAKVFEIANIIPPDVRATEVSEDIFLDAVQRREAVKKHDISD